MKKQYMACGYIVYLMSRQEIVQIGGLGICDECSHASEVGYLVPVLNHWMCPECFEEYSQRAKFYVEDMAIEAKNAAYYEARIPLETEGEYGR